MTSHHQDSVPVHPATARSIVDQITSTVLHKDRFVQTYPGVFVDPRRRPEVLVLVKAAPLSLPAIKCLRDTGRLMTFLVVQYPHSAPEIAGPRKDMSEGLFAYPRWGLDTLEWMETLAEALSRTRDSQCVMGLFEVCHATTRQQLSDLTASSEIIASKLPFEFEATNNTPFRNQLQQEMDADIGLTFGETWGEASAA